jgi:CO dehydrogenase nickel-insertion accessory protein CooC1
VTVLLANRLCQQGYRVAVLDADSTNIGLAQAFGAAQAPRPLLAYFGGMVFSGGAVTCPVDDPTPLPGSTLELQELPAAYQVQTPAGVTLLEAGKIGALGPGAGCDGPVAKIARDVRLLDGGEPPITLVDFKAGFEDAARGVLTGLDWALVVVDPTRAAVEMAGHLQQTVDQIRAGALPATRHLDNAELVALANRLYEQATIKGVLFLLNKIDNRETERTLRKALATHGIYAQARLPGDSGITRAWLQGQALSETKTGGGIQELIAAWETRQQKSQALVPAS